MKNIKYIGLILISFLFFYGCSNQLEVLPITETSTANFYKNASDIETGVNATYGGLQSTGQYGFNYFFLLETRSDNAFEEEPSNAGGFGTIDLFDKEPTNIVIAQTWKDSYITIQGTNIILNRIDAIQDMDATVKNTRKGEMLFIRALTYYNLAVLFGDVPLVTEETQNPNDFFGQGRTAVSTVYSQIIDDLIQAASFLPNTNQVGRATKGAANTLLAKVYLTSGKASEAETVLRTITGYTLLPNYADVFGISNENNAESIFEVQFQSGVNGGAEGSRFATLFRSQANAGSRGNNIPTNDLVNSFEIGDLRRNQLIPDPATPALSISTKYIDNNQPQLQDGSNNAIVLRYADVILMLAEALNEQSYVANGEAFDLLNEIRNRAGLSDLTSATITNQNEFRDALLNERRFEFFHENHRWPDLLRLGNAIQTMNNHFANIPGVSVTINQTDLLFPIPQGQIDTDPAIVQNPGY